MRAKRVGAAARSKIPRFVDSLCADRCLQESRKLREPRWGIRTTERDQKKQCMRAFLNSSSASCFSSSLASGPSLSGCVSSNFCLYALRTMDTQSAWSRPSSARREEIRAHARTVLSSRRPRHTKRLVVVRQLFVHIKRTQAEKVRSTS